MILIFCDSFKRYSFFKRLELTLESEDILVVTSDPLVYLQRIFSKRKSLFLSSTHPLGILDYNAESIELAAVNSIEVINGEVEKNVAVSEINSALLKLDRFVFAASISQAIVWNGQQLLGRIFTLFCQNHGIRTTYLEISNLPNKLFADCEGVNALSSICRCPHRLEEEELVNEAQHADWKLSYIEQKKQPLPQAKVSYAQVPILLTNKLLKIVFRGIGDRNIYLKRLKRADKSHRFSQLVDGFYPAEEFVFFPLQVTNDTQLKLHSSLDLRSAIIRALDIAKEQRKRLAIKMHPAESSVDIIDFLEEIKKDPAVFISQADAIDLIQRSSCVVTINSTVGLEALIFGKELITLGTALYQDFSEEKLLKYIHGYLIDGIDAFGDSPIPLESANQIMAR